MAATSAIRWVIATPILLAASYGVIIGLLTVPALQRHAVYAHKVSTAYWDDLTDAETFGFARNQVRAFNLTTADSETLLAWHVLPLDVYALHREELASAPRNTDRITSLLTTDPEARVLISFHGNAGHVGQGWRSDMHRALTAGTSPRTHVFTVDYRGFGRSTGTPGEAGLIADGVALVQHVLDLGVAPDRIAIVGQSLGTAVASAVALSFADPGSALLPRLDRAGLDGSDLRAGGNATVDATGSVARDDAATAKAKDGIFFAGVLLIAPFTSLPNLLLVYRGGGFVPLFAPLRSFEFLPKLLDWAVIEKWPTMLRLEAYLKASDTPPKPRHRSGAGDVHIIHAYNDMDISFRQSVAIWHHLTGDRLPAMNGHQTSLRAARFADKSHKSGLTLQFVEHGGHNRVCTYSEVALAAVAIFEKKG